VASRDRHYSREAVEPRGLGIGLSQLRSMQPHSLDIIILGVKTGREGHSMIPT
jgi:hypothetical protein